MAVLLNDYKGLRSDTNPQIVEDVKPAPASRVHLGLRGMIESSGLLVRSLADKLKAGISVDDASSTGRWDTLPLRLRASTR
eukprot:CAMPEP_0172191760 /NCGR_PEP_ID=MMETSP1050-20130122/23908_1 /TAXON_ID=233186 /ORGANISM="Cryptomonas curvata, Strain CCAP979/52" /LENGTH=80 /DNA_ID=CAMNT_0012866901 /DNA_START=35 /DNA_END=280 /DNA_ORIENTATION=+